VAATGGFQISGGRKRSVVSHSHFVEFKTMSKGQFILKAALAIIRDQKIMNCSSLPTNHFATF
jgi:hypothetical protein